MWIVSIEYLNNGEGSSSRLLAKTREEALQIVKESINFAKENNYQINSDGDENQYLHIWLPNNPNENYMIYLYEAPLDLEEAPDITSKTYHYRDSYYLECTRDTKSGTMSIYLYDQNCPFDKYGIGAISLEECKDDQFAIASLLPEVDPLIEDLEAGCDEEEEEE